VWQEKVPESTQRGGYHQEKPMGKCISKVMDSGFRYGAVKIFGD